MKFLHTADWQLGKPFARIEEADKAAKVRGERIEAIKRLGKLAIDSEAEFILVAGDVFDSFTAEKSVVSAACSAIGNIEIPVLAIPGNHDHGGPGCLWEQEFFRKEQESLAPNFRILLEREPIELESAVVFPCPLLQRHESSDPTSWVRDFDFSTIQSSKKPRILLAHGSVHGFDSSGDDENEALGSPNLIALDRLPDEEFDYIALGDWHGTKEVNPKVWYCGTPEIDRFPKGEQNDPGNALLVSVDREKAPSVENVATAKLGWHVVSFDFASDDDVNRLEEILSSEIESRAQEDLLHLTLSGSLSISAASQLDQLLETWRARLLRIKEYNTVRLAPSAEEITALTERVGDPLIRNVATGLVEASAGASEDSEIARIALRELFAACTA